MIPAIWKKMFYSPFFFTIALRKRSNGDISAFHADYVIPATYRKWAADPILVEDGDQTYLFYESAIDQKGRIEVVQVYDDCTVSEPTVLLEGECHYSYPFVFCYRQGWYMIPESSESGEVRLYRALEFPYRWEQAAVLLREPAVDTTVFELEKKLYLLTYLPVPGTERVIPQAYRLHSLDQEPVLEKLKWSQYDELRCRGAGPLFVYQGMLLRPAQVSRDNCYGDKVVFYRTNVAGDTYSEQWYGELGPDKVFAGKGYFDGLHTYCATSRFEAIDIRRREFDLFKIPRTIMNRIFHK